MRETAPESVPALTPPANPSRIIMQRDYSLLTPLFGGGVTAGAVDTTTPIHGTGIRGQLRFWWRATQAGRFKTVAEMKAAEDKIWGSTEGVSAVSVAIIKAQAGTVLPPATRRQRDGSTRKVNVGDPESEYGYVAFPLRGTKDQPPGEVRNGVKFSLQLAFPKDHAAELQATLWAWDTFGGVGARTRRGFGAIHCDRVRKLPGSAPFQDSEWRWAYRCGSRGRTDLENFVTNFVNKTPEGATPLEVPRLSPDPLRYKLTDSKDPDSEAPWKNLFKSLRDFRQNRNGRFGRSNWPEPDVIRNRLGQPNPLPSDRQPKFKPLIMKFPRAQFGLPIIFEFKDGAKSKTNLGMEPRKTTLGLQGHGRLASPLIIRPLACLEDGVYVRFRGLAVVLEGTPPTGFQPVLYESDGKTVISREDASLTPGEARDISKLQSVRITTDVLQSFLDTLR